MKHVRHLFFGLAAIVSAGLAWQTAFEAASFQLEDPNSKVNYNGPGPIREYPINRLVMQHTMLKSIISDAYGVSYGNIVGGPGWIDSAHYDLSAKVEGNARLTKEQMQPLLRNLLAERLHLAVHREQKILPGYELVIAKGGPKLSANSGAPFWGSVSLSEIKFHNATADRIAMSVGDALKQPVIDKTGLKNSYDFDLKFRPENPPPNAAPSAICNDCESIFSAVQKQLGLALVPRKVPVDYLIIDRVDKVPTAN